MITRSVLAAELPGNGRDPVLLSAAIRPAALTMLATAAVMPGVIRLVEGRLLDEPNERSSHTRVTPRGGGIGPALVATAILGTRRGAPRDLAWGGITAGAAAMGALGLADDVLDLPPLARLAVQAVVAGAVGRSLAPGDWLGAGWSSVFAAGAAGWVVWCVNAFNFMDGIDGISGVTALSVGGCWVALGTWQGAEALAVVGSVAAGAGAGFLPYNLPKARVFLGDVGSYYLGCLLATGALVGLRSGLAPEAVLAPFAVYLADTASTMLRRAMGGQNLMSAHRDHVYQQLSRSGWSHPATAALVGGLAVICGAAGMLAELSLPARVAGDFAVAAFAAAYLSLPKALSRWSRRSTPRAGGRYS